jgi:glycosyltransferase involved in cell wall biosynthesis
MSIDAEYSSDIPGSPGEQPSVQFLPLDSDEQPTLSVVLPTMNEQEGIGECLRAIREAVTELGVTAEVIVSDSSTDQTPEIARKHGAVVVEPDRPGYGYAYRYAFEFIRGEYVVIGDADTTYDFRAIPKLLVRITDHDADIVVGSRFAGEIKDGSMPRLHRYVGNPVLTWFLNRFYGADVSDAHSGFRILRRDALEQLPLKTDGMEFASEMIMLASARDLRIAEVPITYHQREGEPTLDSFRDGWQHLRFMLLNAPAYLFSLPGISLTVLGMLIMTLAFFNVEVTAVIGREAWFGTRSMVAGSLMTIAGYQITSFGVFATVASDPIRRPSDHITEWVVSNMGLEQGVGAGLILVALGGSYASLIVATWAGAGYEALPRLTHDILAFTLIVVGIQTIFGAFFIALLRSD